MPTLVLLSPEQLAERLQKPDGRKGRGRSPERARAIEQFKRQLSAAKPGYGADVLLDENEDKQKVRQNIKAAADELTIVVEFTPLRDDRRIHFRVIRPEDKKNRAPR